MRLKHASFFDFLQSSDVPWIFYVQAYSTVLALFGEYKLTYRVARRLRCSLGLDVFDQRRVYCPQLRGLLKSCNWVMKRSRSWQWCVLLY